MKTTPLFLLLCGLVFAPGNLNAAPFKTIEVGPRPESVTKGFNGLYYVTVMNSPDIPGDGVVKVIDGDDVRVFAAGLDEPKGITFTGQYLVTTDVDKVWKIDEQGHASLLAAESDFPVRIRFLNDAAAAPDGQSVFISDMGAHSKMFGPDGLWPLDSPEAAALPAVGRIFQISMDGKVTIAADTSLVMPCPNGVTVTGRNRLLIAEFFKGNIIETHKGRHRVLTTGYRGADAIERDRRGNIYVSSWTQGKVWRLDRWGKKPEILIEGMQSAADFYLDEDAGRLIVPDMLAGTVTFVPLPQAVEPEHGGLLNRGRIRF